MKTTFLLALLSSFTFLNCQSQPQNVAPIDVATFEQLLAKEVNAQLIDVRTPQEFVNERIANATNMDWNNPNFVKNVEKFDKSKPVFVYCLSGGRSKAAAAKLAEMGFDKVYDLKGGIMKWNAIQQAKTSTNPTTKTVGISVQEYNKMLQSSPKTVVSIYAEWCAPCKKMTPYIIKMQAELKDKVNIVRYDADANKTILKALNIDALPVILIYEGEKLIWQHQGFLSENDLRKQI